MVLLSWAGAGFLVPRPLDTCDRREEEEGGPSELLGGGGQAAAGLTGPSACGRLMAYSSVT